MKIFRFGDALRAFRKDGRGSITPAFAVMMLPLTMLAGFSIDLARAHEGRAKLQDAVDAAALALAHQPPGTPMTTLTQQAQTWINADLHDTDVAQPVSVNVTQSNGQLLLAANTTEPAMVSGLVGLSQFNLAANSTVKWGLNHVEVALVLDNTGSMAGTKISTLTSAAQTLVSTLLGQAGADPNAVKISIVPFSMTVNVYGTTTIGAGYVPPSGVTGVMPTAYGPDLFTTANTNRFTLFKQMNQKWNGCVESRPYPYDVQDTSPSATTPASMFVPFFAPDEPDTPTNTGFMNNYLSDALGGSPTWQQRQGNVAKYTGAVKSGSNSNGYTYGPNAGCSLAQMVRLTNSSTVLNGVLNKMQAIGDTNLAVGLQWGWLTLSPNAPFADGVAYNTPNTTKIVVFLTDGYNTDTSNSNSDASYYASEGYIWQNRLGITSGSDAQRSAAMDTRTAAICNNIKADKIAVYTVRIDVSGVSPSVLQNCASTPAQFYDVPNVANLPAAFTAIAGQIGKLRLSQ
jgi:Flp pilus assembly protein TadG